MISNEGIEAPSETMTLDYEDHGEWCAVCHLVSPRPDVLKQDRVDALRDILADVGAVTSVKQSRLVVAFDVFGDLAQATSHAIVLLWEALEKSHLNELAFANLQLVPAAEVSPSAIQEWVVPYFAERQSALDAEVMRDALGQLPNAEDECQGFQRGALQCYNPLWQEGSKTERYEDFASAHEGLRSHEEVLGRCLLKALAEFGVVATSEAGSFLSKRALEYLFVDLLKKGKGLVGPTEAGPMLGVTKQRMSQVAHRRSEPEPILWIAGERPLWLIDDLEVGIADDGAVPADEP